MLGDVSVANDIYIVCGYTDMRKSIDGLCAIIIDQLHMDPRRSSLYLFCGRRCDRIKALLWEADGFVLLYKHLSVEGKYRCPRDKCKRQIREEEHAKREKNLMEQIDYLTKKLFGVSSEHRNDDLKGQLNLFDEAETTSDESATNPDLETVVKEHTRKAKTKLAEKLAGIPVEEVPVDIPEEDKVCPLCGTALELIGKEVIRREIEYIPAKVTVKEYVSYHYGCPECKNTDEPCIIKATTEKKPLMKHSLASPSSVAWTIYQKYANAMPLYRQEKDWKQYGIELSRTTLANWIIYCSKHYFSPLYEFFHRKLLERYFLMADETPVQVLNEPGRRAQTKSYMWVYRAGEDGLPPIILYGYSETRSGDNAKNFLNGFKGYLECDGYQGYNKIPDIKRCSCWAHVRRYLIDAIPKGTACFGGLLVVA